jgi:hypothetical protein
MDGVKKYKNELTDPTELVACEGTTFSSDTDADDRYNGSAKLRCDVNVDCTSQDDVMTKVKIRAERGLKTNQTWVTACLDVLTKNLKQTEQNLAPWTSDRAANIILACNGDKQ